MHKNSLALCIPAYNAAAYLPRLLESAVSQTVLFDEIWVYDDCSTDNTGEVATKFGAKVVRGDVNRGCSHGKNTLALHTNCEWIHFHDSDDALYPNFVETAQKWINSQNPPDVVLFDYECRLHETEEIIGFRKFDRTQLQQDAISYAIREQINPFCGVYHKKAYLQAGGYDTDPLVLYNEDVAFHCRLAIAGLKFTAESTVTIINYCRSNSMSGANQVKCCQAQFHVMRKVAEVVGDRYSDEITSRLWEIAAVSAAYSDWKNVDHCIDLAKSINNKIPQELNSIFKILCQWNPKAAIRLREKLIRTFKPQLRKQFVTQAQTNS
jgi:glycosyltransferase involved in cell wall biosynthesis